MMITAANIVVPLYLPGLLVIPSTVKSALVIKELSNVVSANAKFIFFIFLIKTNIFHKYKSFCLL